VADDVLESVGQWELGVELLRGAGVPMPTAAAHELADVVDELLHPGPFRALSNGDPESNNYLTDGSDGRLIDFESAAFQHVLFDVVSMYVPGPMWLTVGDPGCGRTGRRLPCRVGDVGSGDPRRPTVRPTRRRCGFRLRRAATRQPAEAGRPRAG